MVVSQSYNGKLLIGWIGSLAATTSGVDAPAHFGNAFLLDIGGIEIPVVTSVFAVVGILLSRPLSPKGNPPLSRGKEITVTIILLLLSLAWVIEDRPRLLFTLLMTFGLGFGGFSIIELMGDQVKELIKRFFAGIGAFFDRTEKKDKEE